MSTRGLELVPELSDDSDDIQVASKTEIGITKRPNNPVMWILALALIAVLIYLIALQSRDDPVIVPVAIPTVGADLSADQLAGAEIDRLIASGDLFTKDTVDELLDESIAVVATQAQSLKVLKKELIVSNDDLRLAAEAKSAVDLQLATETAKLVSANELLTAIKSNVPLLVEGIILPTIKRENVYPISDSWYFPSTSWVSNLTDKADITVDYSANGTAIFGPPEGVKINSYWLGDRLVAEIPLPVLVMKPFFLKDDGFASQQIDISLLAGIFGPDNLELMDSIRHVDAMLRASAVADVSAMREYVDTTVETLRLTATGYELQITWIDTSGNKVQLTDENLVTNLKNYKY